MPKIIKASKKGPYTLSILRKVIKAKTHCVVQWIFNTCKLNPHINEIIIFTISHETWTETYIESVFFSN